MSYTSQEWLRRELAAAEQCGAERERARIVALVRERAAIWAPHFQTRARMLLDDLADELERK